MEQWKYFLDLFARLHESFVTALQDVGLASSLIVFLDSLIGILLILAFVFPIVIIFIWLERRFIAWMQVRPGPNRCGPAGLLQPVADAVKVLFKELIMPEKADKLVHWIAPALIFFAGLMLFAVIPIGAGRFGALTDLNIGVLFLLAISSVSVYAIALAGWASNNKYALLGSLRAAAQMISYELPLGIALAAPLLMAGSLSLREIVDAQGGYFFGVIPNWFVFQLPAPQVFGFVIFLIAAFAETNRIPFDLPEAENELVAGFHTEYSSLKFALFFLSEYINMITLSMLMAVFFFGGWPGRAYTNHFPVFFPRGG